MASSAGGAKRERRRRSHIRTFTGCLQCRQRHVKCDESRPTCANCSRMNIACSAYSFIIDMQVSTPRTLEAARKRKNAAAIAIPSGKNRSKEGRDDWSPTSTAGSTDLMSTSSRSYTLEHHVMKAEDDGDETIPGQLILKPSLTKFESDHEIVTEQGNNPSLRVSPCPYAVSPEIHVTSPRMLTSPSTLADEKFLSHFLNNVSRLLIVYDHPHNANAYRLFFPCMAARSEPLRDIMHALGALNLANTTVLNADVNYEVMALSRYATSVRGLREKLSCSVSSDITDLATCLLLVFFEMMESNSSTWKHHLIGARDIYDGLCMQADSSTISSSGHDIISGLRTFLVGTLAYLDISASASSAQAPLIHGQYWETTDGWQYNLGVPCLLPFTRSCAAEDHELAGIRSVKSSLMSIQSEVGALAERVQARQGMIMHDVESIYCRLDEWQAQLPEIFHHLNNPTSQYFAPESIEAALCVRCCQQATELYLKQVTGVTTEDLSSQILIDGILTIVQRLPRDVRQLACLWALFIAGTATNDVYQQTFIRSRMQGMTCFGMRNVDQALEILETVWHRQKHGVREPRWFVILQELSYSLLLT